MPVLDRGAALDWIARWDIQQLGYLPDREERFTALIDAVEDGTGIPGPLVLDLGCGPGSLAVRLLDRLPAATVVGVDADPLLLTLGQIAWPDRAGLRFAEQDLRAEGWSVALGLDRQADAAVSTTALHWLPPPALAAMYAELGTVLRPGGLLLNGDHFAEDEATAPVLARLGRALRAGPGRAACRAGQPDDRQRASRLPVGTAVHPRRRAARGRVRGNRNALAAGGEPAALRGHGRPCGQAARAAGTPRRNAGAAAAELAQRSAAARQRSVRRPSRPARPGLRPAA